MSFIPCQAQKGCTKSIVPGNLVNHVPALMFLQIWFSHRRRKDKTAAQAAQASAAAAVPQAAAAPDPSSTPAALPKPSVPPHASSPVQQPAQTPLGQQLAAVQQARLARSSPPAHIGGPALNQPAPQEGPAAHQMRPQAVHENAPQAAPRQLPCFIAQVTTPTSGQK